MSALTSLLGLAAARPVPAPYAPASIPRSFAAGLADGRFSRTESYVFGTAPVPNHEKQIPISDLATLAKYFRPYKPQTGLFVTNYEMQRYQNFNAVNHAMGVNGIELTANLPTMPYPVISRRLVSKPTGNNILYLDDVSGINLGQMAVTPNYGSLMFVVAIDTSANAVTFWNANAATGAAPVISDLSIYANGSDYSVVDFLPVYVATVSSTAASSALTINCTPTASNGIAPWPFPPQIAAGMQVTAYGTSAFGQPLIQSVNPSTGVITMARATGVAYGVGTRLLIGPPINSGQFWSLKNYWAGSLQKSMAIEFEAILPSALGCWPACWLYGDGAVLRPATTGSEIDVMEMYNGRIKPKNVGVLTATTHAPSGASQAHTVSTADGAWLTAGYWQPPVSIMDGKHHKFQAIWTGAHVYYYVDDIFVCADLNMTAWAGQPASICCDLAVGSFLGSTLQNGLYPANQPAIGVIDKFTVRQINVWNL